MHRCTLMQTSQSVSTQANQSHSWLVAVGTCRITGANRSPNNLLEHGQTEATIMSRDLLGSEAFEVPKPFSS